jgi:hypothetical protein
LLFLTDYSIQSNNPEPRFVALKAQVGSGTACAFIAPSGAEMGIPTMMGKESVDTPRVKAAITTTQSDNSP